VERFSVSLALNSTARIAGLFDASLLWIDIGPVGRKQGDTGSKIP